MNNWNDEEFRTEARRRGYELVARDRIKLVAATAEVAVNADRARAALEEDYLIYALGYAIAAKLVEFHKVEIGPIDPDTGARTARARFAVIVPAADAFYACSTNDELLPDEDRRYLLGLLLQEVPAKEPPTAQVLRLTSQLSGVDTVVVCRRAYPARRS